MRILKITEDSIEFDNIQNGYHSNEVGIWYGGKEVIHGLECQLAE